jgi:hypothetical protein
MKIMFPLNLNVHLADNFTVYSTPAKECLMGLLCTRLARESLRFFPLLTVFAVVLAAAGCGGVSKSYRDGMAKTKQELSTRLDVTRLPISVNVVVDEKTRTWIVRRRPSSFTGCANVMTLPVGQQLVRGVHEAARSVFKDICDPGTPQCAAHLRIRLADFVLEHKYTGVGDIEYSMAMTVEAELEKKDNTTLYKNALTVETKGWGDVVAFSLAPNIGEIGADGLAMLVGLWVRKFAKDITQSQSVQDFAKSLVGPMQAAEAQGPDIVIASPVGGSSTDGGEIVLSGFIHSESPITEQRISVNGRPLDAVRGVAVVQRRGRKIKLNRKIVLAPGENVITVTAANEAGGITQKVVSVTRMEPKLVTEAGLSGSPIGERWAVVVGISKYKHPDKGILPVDHAARDACSFAEFLTSPRGGGFDEKNILLLTNKQATSIAVRRALFTFLKKAIEEDLVIFFFSGQGAPEPGASDNYYLLTYDASPEELPSTAIPTWDIQTAFKRIIKARRAVIFVDACHVSSIGTSDGTRSVSGVNLINRYLKKMAETDEGKVIFTATREGQTAVKQRVKEWTTGMFTHYLLEALSGVADENEDGIVTLGETIDYTVDLVSAASRGKQCPEVVGKFDRNLPLAVLR